MVRGFRHDRFATTLAKELSQAGIEELHIIGDLGHGTDRGAGGAYRVFAVDGNGRRDTINAVHLGPVHTVHELPGVRGECLHVPALSLGVERIKGKRRFS